MCMTPWRKPVFGTLENSGESSDSLLMRCVTYRNLARRAADVVLIVCASNGCHDPPLAPPLNQPDVTQWVTGAAATALDSKGHFVFASPVTEGARATITPPRASDLAAAYLRTFGGTPAFLGLLETQHGAPVNISRLAPSPRLEFASSSYDTVPTAFPTIAARRAGPLFIVRMLDTAIPVVNVSVSLYATEMNIVSGLLSFPQQSGEEFQSFGDPRSQGYSYPVSPERATEIVGRETGARITQVPELLAPRAIYSIQFARWKLTLDRDVALRRSSDGASLTSRVIYVGMETDPVTQKLTVGMLLPKAEQRLADTIFYSGVAYEIRLRAGMPPAFEFATAAK